MLTPPPFVTADPDALAEWERVTPDLTAAGLVDTLDVSMLAAYCATWARYVAALRWLADHDDTFVLRSDKGTPTKLGVAPKLAVAERSLDRAMRLATALGLTPAGRADLRARIRPDTTEPDALDDLIARLSAPVVTPPPT